MHTHYLPPTDPPATDGVVGVCSHDGGHAPSAIANDPPATDGVVGACSHDGGHAPSAVASDLRTPGAGSILSRRFRGLPPLAGMVVGLALLLLATLAPSVWAADPMPASRTATPPEPPTTLAQLRTAVAVAQQRPFAQGMRSFHATVVSSRMKSLALAMNAQLPPITVAVTGPDAFKVTIASPTGPVSPIDQELRDGAGAETEAIESFLRGYALLAFTELPAALPATLPVTLASGALTLTYTDPVDANVTVTITYRPDLSVQQYEVEDRVNPRRHTLTAEYERLGNRLVPRELNFVFREGSATTFSTRMTVKHIPVANWFLPGEVQIFAMDRTAVTPGPLVLTLSAHQVDTAATPTGSGSTSPVVTTPATTTAAP